MSGVAFFSMRSQVNSPLKRGDRVQVVRDWHKGHTFLEQGEEGTVDYVGSGPRGDMITVNLDHNPTMILGAPMVPPNILKKVAADGNESGLRQELMRLAHINPDLRKPLVQLLRTADEDGDDGYGDEISRAIKRGVWNIMILKSQKTKWSEHVRNPQGGGGGGYSTGSIRGALGWSLMHTDFKGAEKVWVIIAPWDWEEGTYKVKKTFWMDPKAMVNTLKLGAASKQGDARKDFENELSPEMRKRLQGLSTQDFRSLLQDAQNIGSAKPSARKQFEKDLAPDIRDKVHGLPDKDYRALLQKALAMGGGKSAAIKMAHENPELRKHLLPLLRQGVA